MQSKIKGKLVATYGLLALLSGIGMILILLGSKGFPPLEEPILVANSTKYSIPTALAAIVCLYLTGADLFSKQHKWLIVLAIVITFFIDGAAIAYQYNGRADQGSELKIQIPIIDKRTLNSRGNKTYFAVVDSWRPGRREERIKLKPSHYDSLSLPAEIKLILKPGAFDFPWVKGYSLIEH